MMSQIAQRIGIPLVLLFLASLYFLEVRGGKEQDLMLIKPVFYLMVVLFIINAATDMRDILRQKGDAATAKADSSLGRILRFAALAVLLVAALPFAGFLISATVFLFLVLFMFEVRNKAMLIGMPIIVALALYLLFEFVFAVELPASVLGF